MKTNQKAEIAMLISKLRRLGAQKQTEMYFMIKGAVLMSKRK